MDDVLREYEKMEKSLRNKLVKSNQLTNREDGYNNGILTAMSMISRAKKERVFEIEGIENEWR